MTKKLLLGLGAAIASVAVIPMFAAFESHVINVTATVENALSVQTVEIPFGTVFPQEHLFSDSFTIGLTEAAASGIDSLSYVIKQKGKVRPNVDQNPNGDPQIPIEITSLELAGIAPINTGRTNLKQVSSAESFFDVFIEVDTPTGDFQGPAWNLCENFAPARNTQPLGEPSWIADWKNLDNEWYQFCYPPLGPYLSKEPVDIEEESGIESFHNPYNEATYIHGSLSPTDPTDEWKLDLFVPCFVGQCAQDWNHFGWELPVQFQNVQLGTDLWIEVDGITRPSASTT